MNFIIKSLISGVLIASISTLAKSSRPFAALIASLPITSILAFIWIYQESKDVNSIAEISIDIFWLVIPSLVFFIALPLMLKRDFSFYISLLSSSAICIVFYFAFFKIKALF